MSSTIPHEMRGVDGQRARWVAVGRSTDPDAATAGARAAGAALEGADAKLLIVFCSDSYDLPALVQAVARRAGTVPVIGCTTAGELSTDGPQEGGVVAIGLGGEGFSVATGAGSVATAGGLREAGAAAAACMAEVDARPHRVLMLLTDGLAGDQREIVRGAHDVAGAGVPLVGGCAGDGLKMQRTFQFHGSEVLTGAVVAAAIASDAPLAIGARHGWRRVGEPMLVTRSADNRVEEIDDRPALDVYLDRLAAPAHVRSDPDAFSAFALTHPLGLNRSRGEDQVRFIAGGDFERRSLTCIAEVPQGALVWLMEGDAQSVLAATDGACAEALAALGGREPLGVVAFDCVARGTVLDEPGLGDEVSRIVRGAGGVPVGGFYTYGEISRRLGMSGFHNQTLVVLAVS